MHDMIVIGGGPAGLSAALNGAAEGLSTLLLERSEVLGGQAGTTSLIENYLGFKNGVSGHDLTNKAVDQAKRLGADLRTDHGVAHVEFNEATGYWVSKCKRGTTHVSKAVVLAVGVDYRRLNVDGAVRYSDSVFYGAPASAHAEAEGLNVLVVGGGNSAGQAAMNLSRLGARVTLLVRKPLRMTMSHYLIERVATEPNIDAQLGEVVAIQDGSVVVKRPGDNANLDEIEADQIYAYIGMVPRTEFVQGTCPIVAPGFVESDEQFRANNAGLYVAGDVRAGSFKRVAAAVGEGAIVAANVWRFVYGVNR